MRQVLLFIPLLCFNLVKYSFKGILYLLKEIPKFVLFLGKLFIWEAKGIFSVIKFIASLFIYFINGIYIFLRTIYKLIKTMGLILWKCIKKFFKLFGKFFISIGKSISKLYQTLITKPINNHKEAAKERKELKKKKSQAKMELREKKRQNSTEKLTLKQTISKFFGKWYNNLSFVKDMNNRREMRHQVLMIDFDSEDAKRSSKKIIYKYVARNSEGKVITDTFVAFSKLDVHSYLLSEGYEVYSIVTSPWIEFVHAGAKSSKTKIKMKELIFFLTQLSTYLKAGVPLVETVKILSRQVKNRKKQKLYESVMYELTMGESFSSALEKQGIAFPKLLINMIKTAEMTGELTETLDDMTEYYTSSQKTRKQMISAMMYPTLVFIFSLAILTFIMVFVVPRFVVIYRDAGSDLPGITKVVIAISDFISSYLLYLLIGIGAFCFLYRYLYRSVRLFRLTNQTVLMKIPVVGTIMIYNEITVFAKTFGSLINHNVFITDSLEILTKITNNEIYKMLIFDVVTNLTRGDTISKSFKGHWAFPVLAYEMLVTGERTGQLGEMMEKVADYYQNEHANMVTQLKAFIEPIMITFLAIMVGFIVLAIVIPMFTLYNELS